MPNLKIQIDFYKYATHDDLVADLQGVYKATEHDTVSFHIDLNVYRRLVYGDFLILLVSAIDYLKQKNIHCEIHMENFNPLDSSNRYISRIDFFKKIGVGLEEEFSRHDSTGRFTEITTFSDYEDAGVIHKKIVNILKVGTSINRSTLEMLEYSLWEVIDNVLNHANSIIGGSCQMQLFPSKREIRLIVCDKGRGIHKALTMPEKSQFKHLKEDESIIECTRQGVTNGDGMGNGLYHTLEFIRHNRGVFKLHSGNYIHRIINGDEKVYRTAYWEGVYLYMKVNTTIDVDHKLIIGETSTLSENFDFLFGETA